MQSSTLLNSLPSVEQIYLESLLEFASTDWLDWIDRVCRDAPRRPITPISESGVFPILSYTNNLLDNYAPQQKPLFVEAVFKQFERIEPNAVNAVILLELLDVLLLIRPYAYQDRIWTILNDPLSELRTIWSGGANIHLQLIALFSILHDGKRTSEPDLFSVYLSSQVGKHPSNGQFIEVSLLHFQRKAPFDFFKFASQLSSYYGNSEYCDYWLRSIQSLLRERLSDAYLIYRWFIQLRQSTNIKSEYNQWQIELRLRLSQWIERRQFYRNDPFVVMLYSELIAGLKPPVAHLISLLCDLNPVPEYDDFNNQYKGTVYRLVDLSIQKYGVYSDIPLPGSRRTERYYEHIVFVDDNELSFIQTHYTLQSYNNLFHPQYNVADRQIQEVKNIDRLRDFRDLVFEVIDDSLDGLFTSDVSVSGGESEYDVIILTR